MNTRWKGWCWSWNSSILVICCKQLTYWKSPGHWQKLRAEGEGVKRMTWLDGITDAMAVSLSTLREMARDREAWRAVVHGVAKSWTWLGDWTTPPCITNTNPIPQILVNTLFCMCALSHADSCSLWTVASQAPLVHGIFQTRKLEWVSIFLFEGIFPSQGLNLLLLCLLHWEADSLLRVPPENLLVNSGVQLKLS